MAIDAADLTLFSWDKSVMRTALACLLYLTSSLAAVYAAEDLRVESIMWRDPLLELPVTTTTFDPKLKDLWQRALRRPESELQRLSADTIALAHQRGMPDLASTADDLIKIVQRPDVTPSVRRAAVHALVVLDAKQYAAVLQEIAARSGLELQMVVEPAIAKWNLQTLREVWERRLQDPQTLPHLRMLAINGLGTLRAKTAKEGLLNLVRDGRAPQQHRTAAAHALAKIGDGGLSEEANKLLSDKSAAAIGDRVLGVYLLSSGRDEAALKQLTELAADPEPAVAAAALGRLFEVDPKLVFPLALTALKNADVNVRRIGVQALSVRGDVAAIEAIASILDDPNPSLRKLVTKSLFELAKRPELLAAVNSAAEKTLSKPGWRGLEQAAILIGHLDYEPASSGLMKLLNHPRTEVSVTVAWSLGRLKVPETVPLLLAHAKEQQARYVAEGTPGLESYRIALQMAQLLQFFGEIRLREADPLMRLFIPKTVDVGEVRTAACWALGKIHEGENVSDLASLFVERLSDAASMPPEVEPVRVMCALSLGRMKSQESLRALRHFTSEGSRIALACWWSIELLTGEKPPESTAGAGYVQGWFLQPITN